MKNVDRKALLAAAYVIGADLYQTPFWAEVEKELDSKAVPESKVKVEPRNVTKPK